MENQKHLFDLSNEIHYFNNAYMSPLLKSGRKAGIEGLFIQSDPTMITTENFFAPGDQLRSLFAHLINTDAEYTAIIPSASYGLATAISNIPTNIGKEVIVLEDEFPSAIYAVDRYCAENKKYKTIIPSPKHARRAKQWNASIIRAIKPNTAAVVMSAVNWSDGTLYDLEAIGEACLKNKAYFIVDGTQAVGAMDIDVEKLGIDALICAGYKWLLAPYGTGMAYYSVEYAEGKPLEESWMNRKNAKDFSSLTQYESEYFTTNAKFNMGEYANFVSVPIMIDGIKQILEWGVDNIQTYCRTISAPLLAALRDKGYKVEDDGFKADHLFGFMMPDGGDPTIFAKKLKANNIHISVRGSYVRVSPYVHTTKEDVDKFISLL